MGVDRNTPGMTQVTFRDIAEVAGVSKTTVSLALHGRRGVSDARRQEILAIAKRLGYRPDPALRALSNIRWGRDGDRHLANIRWLNHAVNEAAPHIPFYSLAADQEGSGMSFDPAELGAAAVRMLDGVYRSGQLGPVGNPPVVLVAGYWVEAGTTQSSKG